MPCLARGHTAVSMETRCEVCEASAALISSGLHLLRAHLGRPQVGLLERGLRDMGGRGCTLGTWGTLFSPVFTKCGFCLH